MIELNAFLAIVASLATAASAPPPADLPLATVEHDDTSVTTSCRLVFAAKPIMDLNGNGVVQITGSNITVDLGGTTLIGADQSVPLDALEGIGIVVTGTNVTLTNGKVRGFRCGVLAQGATGSTFDRLDLSDNIAMHLLSTTKAEDGADWLWPHENDGREWVTRYGAGLCIERASNVTVRDITVRRTQNGIILDRVTTSRIYDNDCSYLSGWGLAMWRSSDNVVAKNAFDFCVRGYSHGVYNRGQDSAGILIFEQSSNNTIALNSATHCGDGLFGFAGKEAIGEKPAPDAAADFTKGRGCNGNQILGNDFSFAAAHGLEMTFSFHNVIARNRFEGNGIAGIWGGYSRDTTIALNTFAKNGGGKEPGEGGGIDIEHGARNIIDSNTFADEGVAIDLWWDDDKALMSGPWAQQNGAASEGNRVVRNVFTRCALGIALRQTKDTFEGGSSVGTDTPRLLDYDEASTPVATNIALGDPPTAPTVQELASKLPGLKTPIGARNSLGGREAIRMTSYGPWDGKGTLLVLESAQPHRATWRLFGSDDITGADVAGGGHLLCVGPSGKDGIFIVEAERPGFVMPYMLRVRHNGKGDTGLGCIMAADWHVTFFPSVVDPRTDEATWREGSKSADSVVVEVPALDFPFGNGGPSSLTLPGLAGETLKDAKLPADRFGTIATTKVTFPKGTFTFRVTSDDGVRLFADGVALIDDWTWHPPRETRATLTLTEPKEVELRVESFELDGFATLSLFVDGELDAKRRAVFGK